MKFRSTVAALLLALAIPAAALATDCCPADGAMGHDTMKMNHQAMMQDHEGMDHGGMAMAGAKAALGSQSAKGVAARGMLKDISAKMSEMGMEMTHHFMIFFTDEATGNAIPSGMAAVKVTSPDGKVSAPIKLIGMGNGFGADITLKEKGTYTLTVGSKVKDGSKRMFSYTFEKS